MVATIGSLVIGLTGGTASAAAQPPNAEATWPTSLPNGTPCGIDNFGTWVRFVANGVGAGTGNFVAAANSLNWTANYTVGDNAGNATYPHTLNVTSVTDAFGNPVQFDAVVAHVADIYPQWNFPRATQSGLLNVPSARNISQVSICTYPPNVTLKIKKVIDWLGETPFSFIPQFIVNVSCVKAPGGTNFANPTSLTLADGQIGSIVAPAGTVCTATDDDAGFVTTSAVVTLATPTAAAATQNATVTNTRKRTLTLTKSVVYPEGWVALPADPVTFSFAVTCNGSPVIGSPFDLAAGGSTAILVPNGQTCSVTETDGGVFIMTSVPASPSAVVMNASKTVAFTNTRETGHLRITKTAVGGNGSFSVTVNCGEGHSFPFTLATTKGSAVVETEAIPTGTSCTVTEAAQTGWTMTAGPTAPIVVGLGINDVAFTNVRDTGDLVVTKQAIGGTGTFTFTATCADVVHNLTIDTAATDTASVLGLPTGTTCVVSEPTTPAGWSFTSIAGPGKSTGATMTLTTAKTGNIVSFVNTRDTGIAHITKTVDGGSGTFTFTVTCGALMTKASIAITAPATSASVDLSGLPTGTCTAAETGHPAGYSDAANQDVTITKGTTTNVDFRNDRQIDLAVVKTAPAAFIAGSTVAYTLQVTNIGPATETHAVVKDTLPTGLAYVSAVGTGWTCTAIDSAITCDSVSAVVAGGAYAPITLTVKVTGAVGKAITNTATVAGDGIDPNLANNTSSVTKTPTAAAIVEASTVPGVLPRTGRASRMLAASALALFALGLGCIELTKLPARKRSGSRLA